MDSRTFRIKMQELLEGMEQYPEDFPKEEEEAIEILLTLMTWYCGGDYRRVLHNLIYLSSMVLGITSEDFIDKVVSTLSRKEKIYTDTTDPEIDRYQHFLSICFILEFLDSPELPELTVPDLIHVFLSKHLATMADELNNPRFPQVFEESAIDACGYLILLIIYIEAEEEDED